MKELRLRDVATGLLWLKVYQNLRSGLAAMRGQNRQADLYDDAARVELVEVEVTVSKVVATGTRGGTQTG